MKNSPMKANIYIIIYKPYSINFPLYIHKSQGSYTCLRTERGSSMQVHPAMTEGQFSSAFGSAQVLGHADAE